MVLQKNGGEGRERQVSKEVGGQVRGCWGWVQVGVGGQVSRQGGQGGQGGQMGEHEHASVHGRLGLSVAGKQQTGRVGA